MKTTELIDLIEGKSKRSTILADGLRISRYENGVINVDSERGDLTRTQIDAFRAVLAKTPYFEKESWIATQGMSWLSDGMRSVSMEVAKR